MIFAPVEVVKNIKNVTVNKLGDLQSDGLNIISDLRLIESLSALGETHLVGNIAFNTTIKPDIDIQIYPNSTFEESAKSIKAFLKTKGVKNILIRKLKISNKTLVLGMLEYNYQTWNIDIALTNKSKNYLHDSYQYFLDNIKNLSEEKRLLIVEFKKEFCKNKIIFDNPSYYIYRGVLENNITSSIEMEKYLSTVKKQMKREKK